MRIGVFRNGWWKAACDAVGMETLLLPIAEAASGNPHDADLASRQKIGPDVLGSSREQPVDLLLDNGAAGVSFVPAEAGALRLTHEAAGVPLCSHFVDPVPTVFAGLGLNVAWPCLRSSTWIKAVWDRTLARELSSLGVPAVMHLPMAAPNRPYCLEPLDPRDMRYPVSFVGAQNTSFFSAGQSFETRLLLPGTLIQGVLSDMPQASFFEVYHHLYRIGEPPYPTDDPVTQVRKVTAYFNAKLFFNAAACIQRRDRFVIFLKHKLGDAFHLVGRGWDRAYGLSAQPPFPTAEEYVQNFRESAINVNLVNGNAETGLNMRHFEITAAGGFLLCYDQPELGDSFEIGRECAVFRNERELLEQIEHFLSHPEERAAIALAGQQRTLSEHLYSHRLRTLLGSLDIGRPAATLEPESAPPGTRGLSEDGTTKPKTGVDPGWPCPSRSGRDADGGERAIHGAIRRGSDPLAGLSTTA